MEPPDEHASLRPDRSVDGVRNHYDSHGRALDLRDAFARHAGRFEAMSVQGPEVYADFSKTTNVEAATEFGISTTFQSDCLGLANQIERRPEVTTPKGDRDDVGVVTTSQSP